MRVKVRGSKVKGDGEDLQWDPGDCHPQVLTPSPVHMLTLCLSVTPSAVSARLQRLPPMNRGLAIRPWAIGA